MKYKEHKQYRLPDYDYSEEGNYFVTICTFNREEYFGKIIKDKMILVDGGKIVDDIWKEIPNKFENVKLDVYQIMPDHFHGIIKICRNLIHQIPKEKNFINPPAGRAGEIPTIEFKSGIRNNPMELKSVSLGRIIRWFKGRTRFEIEKVIPSFKWQSRFYDRIIRDDKEFYFISEYIENNPLNWGTKILDNYFNTVNEFHK